MAIALDEAGQEVMGIEIIWKIDDPTVGRVLSDGSVKGLNRGDDHVDRLLWRGNQQPRNLQRRVSAPHAPFHCFDRFDQFPSQTPFVGNEVRFVATAEDADGNTVSPAVTFAWTSSPPEVISIDQRGSATALAAGSATITATAENGINNSMVVTVSADNIAPTARITTTATSGIIPFTVTFDAAGSSDPDGSILSYTWTFGDGSPPAQGAVTEHTYQSTGEHSRSRSTSPITGGRPGRPSITITANSPPRPRRPEEQVGGVRG
ncbi:MAG: PKD domain-containing protein [Candidatus Manganitrophus sp.]|nr:PKD domain-containing protein [Candidatus Manganitrophus sp.]